MSVRSRWRAAAKLALATSSLALVASDCQPGSGSVPDLSITLNAVPDAMNDLLIVPPWGFVVNVTLPAGLTMDPAGFAVAAGPWDGSAPVELTSAFEVSPSGAVGVIPEELSLRAPNSYTLAIRATDGFGQTHYGIFDFSVREHPTGPPLGYGQIVWYDFSFDRDGDAQPDFPVDLRAVGLGSLASPALSQQVQGDVVQAIMARLQQAYWALDPNGIGADPVPILFVLQNPAVIEHTRICVAGQAPGQPNLIGSILIDPGNQNRTSVECGSIPPTGIFPRGLLAYQTNYYFQGAFDPLMTSRGGTPVGEHALDPTVLDPDFDPGSATPAELARYEDIQYAVEVYSNALGSIAAHETGHALGLVQPAAPGLGLFGGVSGANYSHDVNPDGSVPAENFLMKGGPSVKFQDLVGLGGKPLPFFRPLDFAYLRDRAVLDPLVTALLPAPHVTGVSPQVVTANGFVTATGSNFAGLPGMRLENAQTGYDLLFVQLVSPSEVRGFASVSQIVPGSYTLIVTNPDGQSAVAPVPVVIQP